MTGGDNISDAMLIEISRLYRETESRIKRSQLGELFNDLPTATGKQTKESSNDQSDR
jgi:hypothetical protein